MRIHNLKLYLSILASILLLASCEKHEILDRGVTAEGARIAFYQTSIISGVAPARPVCFWVGTQKISGTTLTAGTRFPSREFSVLTPATADISTFFPGKIQQDSILIAKATAVSLQQDKYYNYFLYDQTATTQAAKVFEVPYQVNKRFNINIELVNLVYGAPNVKMVITKMTPAQNFTVPRVAVASGGFEATTTAVDFPIIRSDSATTLLKSVSISYDIVDLADNAILGTSANVSFTEGRTYMIVIVGPKAGATTTKRLYRWDVYGIKE